MVEEDRINDMNQSQWAMVQRAAGGWNHQQLYARLRREVYGQDRGLMEISLLINAWLQSVARDSTDAKYNFLLAGESGCGKTTFVNALREAIKPIPVQVIDSSVLTTAGFKGCSIGEALSSGILDFGAGVIVLDEIDKMMVPKFTSKGENVSVQIQNEFLKLMDGESTGDNGCKRDTHRYLFIGVGAFSDLRRAEAPKTVGFGVQREQKEARKALTLTDIASFGGSEQFIGRFLHLVNFNPVNRETYRRIVRRTVAEAARVYSGARYLFDEAVQEEIIDEAINGEFGCRGLRQCVWNRLLSQGLEELYRDGQSRTA